MCYGTEYPEKAPVANSLRQEVIVIIRLGKLISSFELQASFLYKSARLVEYSQISKLTSVRLQFRACAYDAPIICVVALLMRPLPPPDSEITLLKREGA